MIQNSCKIVFLDIDGVLNRKVFNGLSQSTSIEPKCVGHLNRVLIETGAAIVLSSAWRYMLIRGALTLDGFDYLLRTHGVVAGRLVSWTCSDEEEKERGWQIHRWRNRIGHTGKYVVIDDLDLGISQLHPFVHTDGEVGLIESDADEAIRLLIG